MGRGVKGPAPRSSPWHCRHNGPGSFNEDARRASHEELAVGKLLMEEGHQVRTVAEGRGGRSPDLLACGVTVEVKSFMGLAERRGHPPRPDSVANKLLKARGQGSVAVVWGPTSGLTETVARAGVEMFEHQAAAEGFGLLRQARVLGKGFDLTFSLSPALTPGQARRQGPGRRPPPPALGAGA